MKMVRVGAMMLLGVLGGTGLLASGCSVETGEVESGLSGGEEQLGSLGFQLVKDPNFYGNSVKVCGKRREKADSKYPCLNDLNPDPMKECVCLNFDEQGKTQPIKDLCPSVNIANGQGPDSPPGANWDFSYVVYNSKDCTGTPLTDPDPTDTNPKNDYNFVCYDKQTPFQNPNQSKNESLRPGENKNDIFCVTKNASKEWNFDVCVDKSTRSGRALDCGCKPNPDPYCPVDQKCQCPENGLAFPAGWAPDPNDYCLLKPTGS